MSDKVFRWGVLVNLTAAVVGGIVLGCVWLGSAPSGDSAKAGPVNHEHQLTWTDPMLRQQLTGMSNALTNFSSSINELAKSQKELAAGQQRAAENGRYQQLQTNDSAATSPQFFDTRTGEVKGTQK